MSIRPNNNEEKYSFEFKIENCVGSANLGITIDLQELYKRLLKLQNEMRETTGGGEFIDEWPFLVRHQPREFPGLILKLRYKVRASLLIFSSGNIVITGAKSREEIEKVAEIVVDLLRKAGFNVEEIPRIELQNIVASADLKKPINLELVAMLGGEKVAYEPEIFPGLIYRIDRPKVVLLLFRSGKVVCTGAKSREMIIEALKIIDEQLREMNAYVEELSF
ncbi:MAG: TATA-box-binding protein [Candidatus Njordarchaeales archaeon]